MAGGREKISEAMQQNGEKKEELSKSILMLKLEWNNYEGELDTTAACLQECCIELDAKEKHLASLQESVAGSLKELDLIRESVERRRIQVETKEQEFHAFHEREIRDMESKWKELSLAKEGFDEVVKLSEDKLNEQEKTVERLHGEAQLEHERLKDLDKSVGNRVMEIIMREKELEERSKEINTIQSWIREETDALHLKEKEFTKRVEEFEVKEMILQKKMKAQETILDSTRKGLLLKGRSLIAVKEELRVKENNLDSLNKELQEMEHNLGSIQKKLREKKTCIEEVEAKEKILQKEIETEKRNLESVREELELKENSLLMVKEELGEKETNLESLKKELLENEHNLGSIQMKLREKETCVEEVEAKEKILQKETETEKRNLESVWEELKLKENSLLIVKEELGEKETNLGSLKKEILEKEHNLDFIQKELRELGSYLDLAKMELKEKVSSLKLDLEKLDYGGKKFDSEKQVEGRFHGFEQRQKHDEVRFKVLEEKEKQLKTLGETDEPINNVAVDKVGAIFNDSVKQLVVQLKECNQFLTRHNVDGSTSAKAQKPQHTQDTSTSPCVHTDTNSIESQEEAIHLEMCAIEAAVKLIARYRPLESVYSPAFLRKRIAKLQGLRAALRIQNQQPRGDNIPQVQEPMTRKHLAEGVIDHESPQQQQKPMTRKRLAEGVIDHEPPQQQQKPMTRKRLAEGVIDHEPPPQQQKPMTRQRLAEGVIGQECPQEQKKPMTRKRLAEGVMDHESPQQHQKPMTRKRLAEDMKRREKGAFN